MKVVGFERKSYDFDGRDGRHVSGSGYTLYLTDATSENVTGVSTERIFLSDQKLRTYLPAVGDNVNLEYNKYGKVGGICKI